VYLFAHPLDFGFQLNDEVGDWSILALRANGVGFAANFLEQEF
jgi:hypothetical protein